MVSLFSHNNRLTNISLSLIELPIKSKEMLGTGWEFIIWSLEIIRLTQPISWSLIKKILVIKILIFFTSMQVKVKIINFTLLEFSGSGPQSFYQWQSFCEWNKTLKSNGENYTMTVCACFGTQQKHKKCNAHKSHQWIIAALTGNTQCQVFSYFQSTKFFFPCDNGLSI